MKQLHKIQRAILYKLLFSSGLRYTDVKPTKRLENNQFDFHLDQLIKHDYIEHVETKYFLTSKGKEYANRVDKEEKTINHQAKVGVFVCCYREKLGKHQFLIYTRLKQPFYGSQGFMSGKVKYGEKICETAKRELLEETHLVGEPELVAIRHYHVIDEKTKDLLEDKFLFLCAVKEPTGKLRANNEGKFQWVNEEDLKKVVTNHFVSFSDLEEEINLVKKYKKGKITFIEKDHYTNKF